MRAVRQVVGLGLDIMSVPPLKQHLSAFELLREAAGPQC